MNNNYIVATIKPWNIEAFHQRKATLPGTWHLITSNLELTIERLEEINPRYIFFPHWSWIVPTEILERWECVCFHMADVPYGRGGSPLQNLIVRGHKNTKISALKMVSELDAGPVYEKLMLSLEGTAQDIFQRMAPLILDSAKNIANKEPIPQEQTGEVTLFKRRKLEESEIPLISGNLEDIYDHIRMLDAETYPKAFIQHGDLRIEFDKAILSESGKITAQVNIVKK